MKVKPILPYVTTPGLTVAYNRVREVAAKPVDVTTAVTVVYGGSGAGKSELLKKIRRDLAWPAEPGWYVKNIRQVGFCEFSESETKQMARTVGILDNDNEEAFFELFGEQWDMDRHYSRSGEWVWAKLRFLADRLDRPYPNPLACLPLFGIHDVMTHRLPILLEAMVKDDTAMLHAKLLLALGCQQERWHFRSMFLTDLLRKLPGVLIVDEADVLHEESLHALRQLCDYTGTPLVLAGTDRLRTRLLSNPVLRPLATRVGMRVELGTVTLPDLKKSLPGMEQEVLMEVFHQGGGYFRTISILLGRLRDFQEANPNRKITREVVQMVAKRVLSSAGTPAQKGTRVRQEDLVFTPEDLGEEDLAESSRATANAAHPVAARVARKVG